MRHRTEKERETLIYGVILLVVGIIFLLNTVGLPILSNLWRFWPTVLILIGVLKLARCERHREGKKP